MPPTRRFWVQTACAIALCLTPAVNGCSRKPPEEHPQNAASNATGRKTEPVNRPVPAEIWNEFNGQKALERVEEQVSCGPRPAGSPELGQARAKIIATLESEAWKVEQQAFTAQTPHGPVEMVNLIARFGGRTDTQKAVLASHYDTKKFSTIRFVGANDGGSSTGALVEAARVLAMDPAFAAQIELVFFDGEEAVQQFTETDGLYGSRHYATALRDSGRAAQFTFGLLWDMIGDKDLTVTFPLDSPKELVQDLLTSAEAFQCKKRFKILDRPLLDDHVPLIRIARIPTLDIIDFEFDAWHTADDTMSALSAASLQTIGAITLHALKRMLP